MNHKYDATYTDTFGGEPNYAWVKRADITMPDLTHYGYDGGTNYAKANKTYMRELMRKAKAAMGLTGVRGRTYWHGDDGDFRPYGMATILFISYKEPTEVGED